MTRKNKFKSALICFLLQIPFFAKAEYGNIESIYINMPQEQNPFLSPQQRFEMIEYYKAGQTDSIRNVFGAWTYIDELDLKKDQIKVSHAEGTSFEMKLFITEKDKSLKIGIIESVHAPICSSVVKFYNEKWESVASFDVELKPTDFLDVDQIKKDKLITVKELCELLPPIFLKAEFHKQRNAIIFTNETIRTLGVNKQTKYAKYIKTKELNISNKVKTLCKKH